MYWQVIVRSCASAGRIPGPRRDRVNWWSYHWQEGHRNGSDPVTCKAKEQGGESSIPGPARPAYDTIVAMTEAFCREHLNAQYESPSRRLARRTRGA